MDKYLAAYIEECRKRFEKKWLTGLSDKEKLQFQQRGACWLNNKK